MRTASMRLKRKKVSARHVHQTWESGIVAPRQFHSIRKSGEVRRAAFVTASERHDDARRDDGRPAVEVNRVREAVSSAFAVVEGAPAADGGRRRSAASAGDGPAELRLKPIIQDRIADGGAGGGGGRGVAAATACAGMAPHGGLGSAHHSTLRDVGQSPGGMARWVPRALPSAAPDAAARRAPSVCGVAPAHAGGGELPLLVAAAHGAESLRGRPCWARCVCRGGRDLSCAARCRRVGGPLPGVQGHKAGPGT